MSPLPWYFEPTEDDLDSLPDLSGFDRLLFRKTIHTLRLALILHDAPLDHGPPAHKASNHATKDCVKFVKSAREKWVNKDKFYPLRLTAPSLALISELMPVGKISAFIIFKICVQRTFGVGSEDVIKELDKAFSKMKAGDDVPTDAQFKEILDIAGSLGKPEGSKITRPVYGQLQIARQSFLPMLQKFWALANTLEENGPDNQTFRFVYDAIAEAKIPTLPKHGLLVWLIASDLAEWNVCSPPELEDLIAHIKGSGTSGPRGALDIITAIYKDSKTDEEPEDEQDIYASLASVWEIINNPPKSASWLKELVDECKEAQGRELNVIDLEHVLCKISRYGAKTSDMLPKEAKTKRPRKSSSKSKDDASDNDDSSASKPARTTSRKSVVKTPNKKGGKPAGVPTRKSPRKSPGKEPKYT